MVKSSPQCCGGEQRGERNTYMTSPYGPRWQNAKKTTRDSMSIIWTMILFLWEWFPIVLLVIHYSIPSLHQPVFEYPNYTGLGVIAASIVVGAIWVIVEAIRAAHRTASAFSLQIDCFRSTLIGNIVVGWGVWLIAVGTLQWWFPVAATMAIIDMLITPLIAINNAIQKPFAPHDGDR